MISCASCAWRYSRHVAREILAHEPRSLFAMIIERSASHSGDFERRRKAIHNAASYQRRRYPRWQGAGIWGWHAGGDIRGLLALDQITATEFARAFRRHGEIHLRPISNEEARVEVYRAVRSIPTTLQDQRSGRYQSLKIAIAPLMTKKPSVSITPYQFIEPLPMILS